MTVEPVAAFFGETLTEPFSLLLKVTLDTLLVLLPPLLGSETGVFSSKLSSAGAVVSCLNSALTLTLPAGMVKAYWPLPLSVRDRTLPLPSVTVSLSSTKPASGLTVTVTVEPVAGFFGETLTEPFSLLLEVTLDTLLVLLPPLLVLLPPLLGAETGTMVTSLAIEVLLLSTMNQTAVLSSLISVGTIFSTVPPEGTVMAELLSTRPVPVFGAITRMAAVGVAALALVTVTVLLLMVRGPVL